ncbi:MAG: ATP synthase F1 subunit epsilon [Chloracidobacterium sp.]|uniref:ATP synthase epsilon chain n=1 Tax=Chloracidobacterium validum TaxID=2821543 RepID=A0ABX8B7T6_9BACT|nr:ATP synthase F1 subunit epsilon [Chloracidobacterium validum]QUW03024.1 ATP synthase F1 subunit epsilon [Chloracidobacterium validum]
MPLTLDIVTPERAFPSQVVDEVVLPALDGEIGVLPGHAALMSQLGVAGLLTYRQQGKETLAFVAQGFVEVLSDRVTVLTERAELAEDIDIEDARAHLREAELALKQAESERPNEDLSRLRAELESALVRVKTAERYLSR